MTIALFLTSFLEVLKVLSLCGLYMRIFFGVKLFLSCHTFVHKILCVMFSLVCLPYFGIQVFFHACLLHVSFCRKFMRLPY